MKTLQSIIEPLQLDQFMRDNFDRRAVVIRGSKDKFKPLFGWNSFNRVLNSAKQPHPALKVTRGGRTFKPRDAAAAITEAAKGATVIVDDIDCYDPQLAQLMDSLAEEVPDYARVNAYLSYPSAPGFDLHYDTQDFFILQIEGYKRWQVFGATIESPLFQQKYHGLKPPPKETLYLDHVLEPGDVLYCPRGHWHVALADKEPSLHLTLGVFLATGIDLLSWVVDELREDATFRRSLPNLQLNASDNRKHHVERLKSALIEKLSDPAMLDQFRTHRIANARHRMAFNFPHHMVASAEMYRSVERFRRRSLPFELIKESGGEKVHVACAGRLIEFDSRAKGVLNLIMANREVTKSILISQSDLNWDRVLDVLVPLIRHGILEPVENENPAH